jgi:hypothetical protein
MNEPFKYQPLDLSNDEIRLLSISVGRFEGHLFHVPLNKAPEYEALSYE